MKHQGGAQVGPLHKNVRKGRGEVISEGKLEHLELVKLKRGRGKPRKVVKPKSNVSVFSFTFVIFGVTFSIFHG